MSWPIGIAYRDAVQCPKLAFLDSELRDGVTVTNAQGLPRSSAGNFACVFELQTSTGRWAAKCFFRDFQDQQRRYDAIHHHLQKCNLPHLVKFHYLPLGIRVDGGLFPILKMEWVEGKLLGKYIEDHLNDKPALEALETHWLQLLGDLKSARIAHGDLCDGNVLVLSNGDLRLIDYDGMWVPALAGMKSNENGHRHYQDPKRTENDFHERIDEFAGTVIALSIRAVRLDPTLWARFCNDDSILFTEPDFKDTAQSELFAAILGLGDPEITAKAAYLKNLCDGRNPSVIPSADWIGDFLPGYSPPGTPTRAHVATSRTSFAFRALAISAIIAIMGIVLFINQIGVPKHSTSPRNPTALVSDSHFADDNQATPKTTRTEPVSATPTVEQPPEVPPGTAVSAPREQVKVLPTPHTTQPVTENPSGDTLGELEVTPTDGPYLIGLSAGRALFQYGPQGTFMTFNVNYEFIQDNLNSSTEYVWIVASGRPPKQVVKVAKQVQLAKQGNLSMLRMSWRPEDGPFETYIEDCNGKTLSTRLKLPLFQQRV